MDRMRRVTVAIVATGLLAGACSEAIDNIPVDVVGEVRGGTVVGAAVDDQQQPVSGLGVILERPGEATVSTTTMISGGYILSGVPAGTWTLTVVPPPGFDTDPGAPPPATLTVADGQITTVDLRVRAASEN